MELNCVCAKKTGESGQNKVRVPVSVVGCCNVSCRSCEGIDDDSILEHFKSGQSLGWLAGRLIDIDAQSNGIACSYDPKDSGAGIDGESEL